MSITFLLAFIFLAVCNILLGAKEGKPLNLVIVGLAVLAILMAAVAYAGKLF